MRVSDLKLERAGKKLFEEFQSRDEFTIMVGEDSPSNVEEAYAVQEIYMDRKAKDAGGYCGYKIAYTTKVMQERVGATEPVYGRILANGLNRSPTVLKASDYVRIGVECEVAVTLDRDLPSTEAPFSRNKVYDSIRYISLAFEIIDGRTSLGGPSVLQSIATNISGAGVVLGDPIDNWEELDIPGAKCELKLNQQLVGTGMGSDVNGHPVKPVTWISNALASRGKSLRAGDVVITGSMIPPTFLKVNTEAVASMDHLGSVTLNVE